MHDTVEIHTLELGRYNREVSELASASMLDCWLYWLLHAQEFDSGQLTELFPQEAIRQATQTITRISQRSEDKTMYDSREKAIRDRQWALSASRREGQLEGKIEGEIRLIQTLEEILQLPKSDDAALSQKTLSELEALAVQLQAKLRNRFS